MPLAAVRSWMEMRVLHFSGLERLGRAVGRLVGVLPVFRRFLFPCKPARAKQGPSALIPGIPPRAELCSPSSARCDPGARVVLPFPSPHRSALLAFCHLLPHVPGVTLSCGDAFRGSLGCWKHL